jgi:DNA-binding MarR family transcriptional regulator
VDAAHPERVGIVIPMSVRWLSADELHSWRSFIETVGDLDTALERDLAPHGLTLGDYQVLVYLSEVEGHAMRMCDLADQLQLSPSGLTRRLDGLVAAGYVRREPSTADRRVAMGVLTAAGLAKLEEAAPDHVESVRRHIFDHLDAAQASALGSIFDAIAEGLAADHRRDHAVA